MCHSSKMLSHVSVENKNLYESQDLRFFRKPKEARPLEPWSPKIFVVEPGVQSLS